MRTSKDLRGRITHLLTEIEPTLPDLSEALEYLQERSCSLHYDEERIIGIYSPGKKLAISVRRAVRKYHEQIVERMAAGDASVCPTDLHKKYRRYDRSQKLWVCDACLRMQPSVTGSHPVVMRVG